MSKKLREGLAKLKFSESEIERIVPLMEKYTDELLLFNSAYNLVNTNDREEIAVRHILDSLSAAELLRGMAKERGKDESVSIADIGSGGGLPGIPLAAAMPDLNFTLVERMSRRCAFLENEAAILGLKNVTVKNIELEKLAPDSFDIATFRAFRPLDKKMLGALFAVLKQGGLLAAYKAKKANIIQEMQAAGRDESAYKIIPLTVPFLTDSGDREERERNLLVLGNKRMAKG